MSAQSGRVARTFSIVIGVACALAAQDDCTTAIPIAPGLTTGSTSGLVTSTPASCGTLHRDIWYAYASTCNGFATATVCTPGSAAFDTILAVYDGSSGCGNLAPVGCNDDWCATRSSVGFQVAAGVVYYLALGGNSATAAGTFTLSLTCAPLVPNDDCATAAPISNGITVGSNVGATTSAQTAGCPNMGSDVWYVYTAPCSGVAEATFCQPGSATFDTTLAAFSHGGSCSNIVQLACNDDTCVLRSRVLFPVTAGGSYLIAVGGFASNQGTFALSLSCHQPPANDDCAGATPLVSGTNGPFSNLYATDGAAQASACPAGSADLWFSFVAGCRGLYRISACGGGYDSVISVRTGACGSTTEVACNDNDASGACGSSAVAEFQGAAGATFFVRVAAGSGIRGSFHLSVSQPFRVSYSSPLGPGSVAFSISGGVRNGVYLDAITFNHGAYPNGAFFGIDITPAELTHQIATGYPFVGTLDACGGSALPATFFPAFSGMTFYSVVIASDASLVQPLVATPPTTYTIP
jgi:hypothetical protein